MATKKKDFSQIKTNRVYDAIADATAEQETHETQENQTRRRGRKPKENNGGKLLRINMGFYDEQYEYLQTMARVMGMTMTDFCNDIVMQHKRKNEANYKRAMEFRDSLNSL